MYNLPTFTISKPEVIVYEVILTTDDDVYNFTRTSKQKP